MYITYCRCQICITQCVSVCEYVRTWWPGVDWEAAHPAVTSMGTFCKLGKQIPNCPCLAQRCEVVVELWVPQFLSVRPGQLIVALPQPHKAKVPEWCQASQCWFTGWQQLCNSYCRLFFYFALSVSISIIETQSFNIITYHANGQLHDYGYRCIDMMNFSIILPVTLTQGITFI